MGSGMSGMYSGTHGATQASSGGSAVCLHRAATSWATRYANGLSKAQRGKFNTACTVFDAETGKYYYGRNGGIERNNAPKNELLFGKNGQGGILPKESLNHLRVGNCAEVDAVNNALNAGAKIGNLYMTTIHTREDMYGDLKQACENCTYTFRGRVKQNYAGWTMEGE